MPKGDHWHDVRGLTDMDIIGFGVKNGRLTVHFVSKTHSSTYVYTPNRGDEEICCRWIQSDSIGQFFHRSIKPLPYAKIS